MNNKIISILFCCMLISCQHNTPPPLFNHKELQDSLILYLKTLKDVPNVKNRPTTTFINIFARNDSMIVIMDSEPEMTRIVIPGVDGSKQEKFYGSGYYYNHLLAVYCEDKYSYLLNTSSLGSIPKKEQSFIRDISPASDTGWPEGAIFRRELFIDDGVIIVLHSSNPVTNNQ